MEWNRLAGCFCHGLNEIILTELACRDNACSLWFITSTGQSNMWLYTNLCASCTISLLRNCSTFCFWSHVIGNISVITWWERKESLLDYASIASLPTTTVLRELSIKGKDERKGLHAPTISEYQTTSPVINSVSNENCIYLEVARQLKLKLINLNNPPILHAIDGTWHMSLSPTGVT